MLAAGAVIALLPIVTLTAVAASPAAHATPTTHAAATPPPRPEGPCDIYAAGGTPCVAAHSTTRALYASYNGPLYQVKRLSDGKAKDIGVTKPSKGDPGGYANSAVQDSFCFYTTCLITEVYDQSGHGNNLTQAPHGGFSGPAMGGYNNLPVADMAPVTVGGHKAYGVFIEPGMGLRDDDTTDIATGDQPEGMYWIVDGKHYNSGCCFDYGNAEIDSRDDGSGTMETSYFGNATAWYHGPQPGPWVMTDQENNLVGCVNPGSTSKLCASLPSLTSRFVTAVAKGQPHEWESEAGDSQQGALTTMFDGPRVDSTYDPMQKQGAIVLGNGGDNSNGSQGTFYEGVMTAGYPTDATDQAVQANIVAAKYNVAAVTLTPATATATPPGLQTFAPETTQQSTVTYTNISDSPESNVELSLEVPKDWKFVVTGTKDSSQTFTSVAPGASVSATFDVTAGPGSFNGEMDADAWWTNPGSSKLQSASSRENVRDTSPIKINEFRTGTSGNSANGFIELYNASSSPVNIGNWTLTEHATQRPVSSTVQIPAKTIIAGHGYYLLALTPSALAAPAEWGDSTIPVTSTAGLAVGQQVQVGTGKDAETRTITAITAAGAAGPRVPGKIGNAINLTGNGDYVQLPNNIVNGLTDFTISAWVNPTQNLIWSRVFDFGTGTNNYMFLTVSAGGGPLRFAITTSGNGNEQQLTAPSTLPLNTWSHVAVTLSGTTGTLYVNGTAVATNANMTLHPSSLGSTTQDYIGHSQFSADPTLDATVDDFQIYNRALSSADVATLASGQPGAGNVASYKFDETGGTTVVDSSGNGLNGTVVTAPAANSTPLWQPVPDGPITVPAHSTNVPVTSTSGFTVGQKLTIGYGDHLEVATVTAVGTAGAQARLSAAATAGSITIKVTSTANISAGDKIRLDIGASTEEITVASVGAAGAGGTGLTLAAPLQFSHASNLPFSDRGTGVSFTPATRYAHSSNEPVQSLDSTITLNKPLNNLFPLYTALVDTADTAAGYQGTSAPDQWFGGPVLSASAGAIALSDDQGNIADSLNYGGLVDPWNAEGYQGGGPNSGCSAPAPGTAAGAGRSDIRFPDGNDTDSNCSDFHTTADPTPDEMNVQQ
jgi:sRNA-binding protein